MSYIYVVHTHMYQHTISPTATVHYTDIHIYKGTSGILPLATKNLFYGYDATDHLLHVWRNTSKYKYPTCGMYVLFSTTGNGECMYAQYYVHTYTLPIHRCMVTYGYEYGYATY